MTFPFNLKASNLGPHKNLTLPDNVATLETIIFAKNGQGKSFLSRAFQLLEKEDFDTPADHLISFGEEKATLEMTIDTKKVSVFIKRGSPPASTNPFFIFHVFNSDYVRDNIEKREYKPTEKRSGYILGKANIDLSNEKKELQNLVDEKYNYIKETKDNINISLINFSNEYKLSRLNSFKELEKIDIETFSGSPDSYDENAFQKDASSFKLLENIPDDLQDVQLGNKIEDYIHFEEIKKLCSKKIVTSSINDELSSFIKNNIDFIISGLDLYEENKTVCPYCKQTLSKAAQALIEKYAFFKKSEEKESISLCDSFVNDIHIFLNKISSIKSEFQTQKNSYTHLGKFFEGTPCLNDISDTTLIEKSVNILKEKILHKKTNLYEIIDIESEISILQKHIFEYNTLIEKNNNLISELNRKKSNSSSELREIKQKIIQHIKNKLFSKNIKDELDKKEKIISKKNTDIREKELLQKTSVEECLFECLKNNITYFFNDKYKVNHDFTIEFNNNNITNTIQKVLSDGEKTILSFCYYIAEVYTKIKDEDDFEKLFFIIDDPISSLDDDYTYGIVQIIRNLKRIFKKEINHLRYIIVTHNFYFLSTLCRNEIVNNVYYLNNCSIRNFDRKILSTPYFAHLKDVYDIALGKNIPNHTTANSIRQVIEGIKSILAPKDGLKEFIASEINECSTLYTATNDASHGGFFFKEFSAAELIFFSKEVIHYIENSAIKKQIDYLKES